MDSNLDSRQRRLRHSLTSDERIHERDAKLFEREKDHAIAMNRKVMKCQCTKCMGFLTRSIRAVQRHLEKHGRWPRSRIYSGQCDKDSSDEEWELNESLNTNASTQENEPRSSPLQFVGPEGSGHRPTWYSNAWTSPSISRFFPNSQDTLNADSAAETRFQDMIYDIFHTVDTTADDSELPGDSQERMEDDGDGDQSGHAPGRNCAEDILPDDDEIGVDGVHIESDPFATFTEVLKPLYEGASQTILEFTLLLVNLCTEHRVPQNFMNAMLSLLTKKVLPQPNNCPQNWYHAKGLINKLGLNYQNIDACSQGCILFWKEHADLQECPKCRRARYKGNSKIPVNRIRWFPLIPRLLRMYRCPSISRLITWASEHKSTGRLVHHAAESKQWKLIDDLYPDFAKDPRNLRLGLMLDGVNPFQLQSVKHSMWPIMLVNYGLPPWLVTKKFFVMLSVLISGPKSITQENIDIYLEPLYEELHTLWLPGVETVDCHGRYGGKTFNLRAILMWTINDYPALGYISGLCTGGNRSCVVCGGAGPAERANCLSKSVHVNHRMWLPLDHIWRTEAFAPKFNGETELRKAPQRQSADHIKQRGTKKEAWDEINAGLKRTAEVDPYSVHGVKRCSALFKLPYWVHLPVRHCIDVMHMEKNVCESLLGFLLGTKDSKAVRDDLQVRGVRPELWAEHVEGRQKCKLPQAPYSFTEIERDTFMKRLKGIKVPDGYCGNWEAKVELGASGKQHRLFGLKSHDYHVLMQQILPMCIRGLLSAEVRSSIFALSSVFRRLCEKDFDTALFPQLKVDAIETLCRLEMTFPPAFFDVMTHLVIHAVEELEWCGPVHTRWMYFGERALAHFTRYTQTRANVGGSIASCYVTEEALGYMTEYMSNMSAYQIRVWDDEEELETLGEVLKGKGTPVFLSEKQIAEMHSYVLQNIPELEDCRKTYAQLEQTGQLQGSTEFVEWVQEEIQRHYMDHPNKNPDLLYLSRTPPCRALSYKHMWAYGSHFRVKGDPGQSRATYDAGISGFFQVPISPGSDETQEVQYVGELTHIYHLFYKTKNPIILFKARWVRPHDPSRFPSMKIDSDGLLNVNFKQLLAEDIDPYVLPGAVHQVFFLEHESRSSGWRVVMRADPRSKRIYAPENEGGTQDAAPVQ